MAANLSYNQEKAIRLTEYLMRLASLQTQAIRDVERYEYVLWLKDIPKDKGCFTQAWRHFGEYTADKEYDSDIWIEIKAYPEPKMPPVPERCLDWVDSNSLLRTNDLPELKTTITKQVATAPGHVAGGTSELTQQTLRLETYPPIQEAWNRYVEDKWMPWATEQQQWEISHKAYSILFSIHQEQLKRGEDYELVLDIGLLNWETPSAQSVRRHLIVANAQLEFEARLGKFMVRPHPDGPMLRPELDMLDIEEQPPGAEESAREEIKKAADDPWDKKCIDNVLAALVHSINPDGEYHDCLMPEAATVSKKPIVTYAPALILRKRSTRGLMLTLKKIRERIEQDDDIPSEYADLAEIPKPERTEIDAGGDDWQSTVESEIWFPKPSNNEQRRIIEKIQNASGVLVQGPPGTGKSHTIANLICHFLATGQRMLITAKTPRALQVLEGLIPVELRSLSINLLGQGTQERKSLETSVNAILTMSEQWNESRAQSAGRKYEDCLNQLREEQARIEKRLRAIRESETYSHAVADGAYRGTAAQIAQAVAKDATKYDWFTDIVQCNASYELGELDIIQLLTALRSLTAEKRSELEQAWPASIPDPSTFGRILERERETAEGVKSTSFDLDRRLLEYIAEYPRELVVHLHDQLQGLAVEIRRIQAYPHAWVTDAVRDALSGSCAVWEEMHKVSKQIIDSIGDIVEKGDSIQVTVSETYDHKKVLEDAITLRAHLANGGGIGWGPFRPTAVRAIKYILKSVKVNGQPCRDIVHVIDLISGLRARMELERGWSYWQGRCKRAEGPYRLQYQTLKSLAEILSEILALCEQVNGCKESFQDRGGFPEPAWHDEACLKQAIQSCEQALALIDAETVRRELASVEGAALGRESGAPTHPASQELLHAIRTRDVDRYANAYAKTEALNKEKEKAQWADRTLETVRRFTPKLAKDLAETNSNTVWDERVTHLAVAWRWAQARTWLRDYISKDDASSLARRLRQIEEEIGQAIAQIASTRAWSICMRRLTEQHKRHMEMWRMHMGHMGKVKGKHGPYHRSQAQKNMSHCREAVPAWVMPLHRVWDTVDPQPRMFDIIIVDEASQCGFEALPLLYLGKKILIVGDNKQISPAAVGVPQDAVHRLMKEYLHDFRLATSFDVITSLFGQVKIRWSERRIVLREHFRCMPEIIRFSNDLCYSDTPLIPLRQYPPDRLQPLVHVYVEGGHREGFSNNAINKPEAEAIVNKIIELCRDDKYSGKTMGVVVLQGEAQGRLIEGKLLDRLGAEEMEKRRLICGNPYSFQGDERDIIFMSMVAAPNQRIGPFVKSTDEQRFNVAASRARDQMWLFHSVRREDLSVSCLRRRLLEFFEQTRPYEPPGPNIEELRRQAWQANRSIEKAPQPFESWFEVDVGLAIASRGYRVIPQFEVAGRRIDLVIIGGQARLAVECDGDEFHGADQYESDMQRQRMLERCEWVFYRVRASEYYANRESALAGLWKMLEERHIYPIGGQETITDETATIIDQNHSGSEEEGIVEVGDTVVFEEADDPGNQRQALISRGPSNNDMGIVNVDTPIARALLGKRLGDIVEAKLPMGISRFIIKEIKKRGH